MYGTQMKTARFFSTICTAFTFKILLICLFYHYHYLIKLGEYVAKLRKLIGNMVQKIFFRKKYFFSARNIFLRKKYFSPQEIYFSPQEIYFSPQEIYFFSARNIFLCKKYFCSDWPNWLHNHLLSPAQTPKASTVVPTLAQRRANQFCCLGMYS